MTALQTPQAAPPGEKAPVGNRNIFSIAAIWSRTPWTGKIGLITITSIMVLAFAAPWIAPYDPNEIDLVNRLTGPSGAHWLGVDNFGRDVLSRLLYGGRLALFIAAISVLISIVVGTLIGAASGQFGGFFDEAAMRFVDLSLGFPTFIIALVIVAILGPGFFTLILALSFLGWTPYARLVRGQTLSINSQQFIEAAEALGCSRWFIITRHIVPHTINPVLAMGFLRFGHMLIRIGALSYLGLGVQPPDADWGAMLREAQPYMQREPWLIIFPGLAIFISALAVTLAGQGLSHAFDARAAHATMSASLDAEEQAR